MRKDREAWKPLKTVNAAGEKKSNSGKGDVFQKTANAVSPLHSTKLYAETHPPTSQACALSERMPGYSVVIHREKGDSGWIRVYWSEEFQDLAGPSTAAPITFEGKDPVTGRPTPEPRQVIVPEFIEDLVNSFREVTDPLVQKQRHTTTEALLNAKGQLNIVTAERDQKTKEAAELASQNAALRKELELSRAKQV